MDLKFEGSTVRRNTQRPALETGPRPFKITVLDKHKSCACTCTESKILLLYRSRVLLEGSTVGRNTQRPASDTGPRPFKNTVLHKHKSCACTCTESKILLLYRSRVLLEGSTVGRNTQRPASDTGPRPFKNTVLHKHKSCACTCTESKTLLSYRSRVLLEGSTLDSREKGKGIGRRPGRSQN